LSAFFSPTTQVPASVRVEAQIYVSTTPSNIFVAQFSPVQLTSVNNFTNQIAENILLNTNDRIMVLFRIFGDVGTVFTVTGFASAGISID